MAVVCRMKSKDGLSYYLHLVFIKYCNNSHLTVIGKYLYLRTVHNAVILLAL
jgi:hypothetical protein